MSEWFLSFGLVVAGRWLMTFEAPWDCGDHNAQDFVVGPGQMDLSVRRLGWLSIGGEWQFPNFTATRLTFRKQLEAI